MSQREIVLCHPVRTAIGTYNGSLKSTPATDLGAAVVRETLKRSGLDAGRLGAVVMGNVIQAGNRMNPARQAAIHGGVPVEVPAMTVNRVCGSGAQAIASAAQEIWLGHHDAAVAGGMENMDMAPYLMTGGRWGYRMGNAQIYDSMLHDGLNDAFSGEHSGWHTEDLVSQHQISRADQDRWAERSQQRFSKAQAEGKFDEEIVPVEIKGRKGPEPFARDEHNRADTTLDSLVEAEARLPQGWHDHRRQRARAQHGRGRDDRGRARLRREERPQAERAPCSLWHRRRGAGHVRHRAGAGGAPGPGAGRLVAEGRRPGRDQRGLRRHRARGDRASWASPRTSSTSRAARLPTAIPSGRRARS